MNKSLIQQLADERLKDAEALRSLGRWSGAYYLCGYAVELSLKACVLRHLGESDAVFGDSEAKQSFRDYRTHDLKLLIGYAGLKVEQEQSFQRNRILQSNWIVTAGWSEKARYKDNTETYAQDLFAAVNDPADGVFQWTRSHW